MPFELIMLLGFFGTVLLSLLPTVAAEAGGESLRGRRLRRSDGGRSGSARHGRASKRGGATRHRRAGHAAA